jgi:tetratricopeptide (TPR) repeat protein
MALVAVLLGLLAPAARAENDLARLSAELALHPDDPALVRALARAQLERGDAEAAIATLRTFADQHPEQRPQLAQLLGRALYEQGELGPARASLEEAIAYREDAALAHFYLGLVLLREGDAAAASRELTRAAQLDRGLADSIRKTTAPVPQREAPHWYERFAFAVGTGYEYDTNPTLAGDESLSTLSDTGSDFRLVDNVAVGVELLRTERSAINLSYRYDESRYNDHEELDLRSHGAGLGGVLALGSRGFLRLDGGAAWQQLDHANYLQAWSVGPALGYASEGYGLVQLRGFAEQRDFAETPLLPSLERDGWRYGAALQHNLPVQLWAPGLLTSQLQYARTRTDAETVGFDSAFDSNFYGADTGLSIPLFLGIQLQSRLLVGYESFDEENVIAFLTDDAVTPDPHPDRRRDTLVDATLSFVRPLSKLIDIELRVRESRRFSNVGVYDSDRQVIGTYLHLHFDP